MRVHVVGNLCRDTTLAVPRFPVPGETLVADGSRTGFGGKGLNQAVAAARAGATVVLHAAVGPGEASAIAAAFGDEARLDLCLVEGAAPTDTSTILVRPDGENLIVSACAAARGYDPTVVTGAIEGGDLVLMQGNLARAATLAVLHEARRLGALTVLNPSPLWDDGGPVWRDVDLLVANAGELRALTGEAEPSTGAAALVTAGAGAVAVTLGARGILYQDGDARHAIAAGPVAVLDTTGAGDVFCGVLVGLMAGGFERHDALARATAAASLSVTRAGALAAVPTAAELAALFPETEARSPA